MNIAVTMRGAEWFAREPKAVVFDLPDSDYSDDAERTLRRPRVSADATEEIEPSDVLAEFPLDPEEPFELRVPHAILARAAQLTAALPRRRAQEATAPVQVERSRWVFASIVGVCAGILFAGAMAYAATAPIEPAPRPQLTLQRAATPKVIAARVVTAGAIVPTVSFDSLPRARRR